MPIAVCVPLFDPHPKFLPHFIEWYAANKAQYDLRLAWSYRRPLHYAQHDAVELARARKCSHVLFVEDDHWGFPVNGLEFLLKEDKEVIGFPAVSRRYPYHSLCMRKIDPSLTIIQEKVRNMRPFEYQEGQPVVQTCDLISWAFLLVRIEVFDRIQDPFDAWRNVPTDSYFCQHCEDVGIPRHVHFGYIVPHGDIEPQLRFAHQKVDQYRRVMMNQPMHPGRENTLSGQFTADLELAQVLDADPTK